MHSCRRVRLLAVKALVSQAHQACCKIAQHDCLVTLKERRSSLKTYPRVQIGTAYRRAASLTEGVDATMDQNEPVEASVQIGTSIEKALLERTQKYCVRTS